MRLALPCIDDSGLKSEISPHFGRSPFYTFVDVVGGEVRGVEVVPVPFEEHGPGDLPSFVKERGGEVVIAYGMGGRAISFFQQLGIKVITGASGRVGDVVNAFIKGNLSVDREWKSRGEFGHHEQTH